MKETVRDLIVNACSEARLVNRNQPIPGNIFLDCLMLLKKRLAQYSNTNYLSFIRKELNFITDKETTLLGELELKDEWILDDNFFIVDTNKQLPDPENLDPTCKAYIRESTFVGTFGKPCIAKLWNVPTPEGPKQQWRVDDDNLDVSKFEGWNFYPDIEVTNLQEVVRCFVRPKDSKCAYEELRFVSYEDFYMYDDSPVFSILPIKNDAVKFMIKNNYLKNYEIKVIYNEHFDFNADDELDIPGQFISLFTAGLVYDLAIQYPRLSDTTVALLRERLDTLEKNVERSSSVNKFITRSNSNKSITYNDFYNGSFIFRG